MTIAICIACVLLACGVGLIAWAFLNPRWKTADAYDAYGPLLLGSFAVIAGAAVGFITAQVWVVQNHLRG